MKQRWVFISFTLSLLYIKDDMLFENTFLLYFNFVLTLNMKNVPAELKKKVNNALIYRSVNFNLQYLLCLAIRTSNYSKFTFDFKRFSYIYKLYFR